MRSLGPVLAFRLNGIEVRVSADPEMRLADLLRDTLGLTGTKIGCNAGDCGACTVLLDGAQMCACMMPAARVAGQSVITVEGLAEAGKLSALQAAFLRHGAAQCGICTPGMILAAHHLLDKYPNPTMEQIQEGLAGNLCRCTGYMRIFESVQQAAQQTSELTAKS